MIEFGYEDALEAGVPEEDLLNYARTHPLGAKVGQLIEMLEKATHRTH